MTRSLRRVPLVLAAIAVAIAIAHPARAQQRESGASAITFGVFVPTLALPLPQTSGFAVADACTKHPEDPGCAGDPLPPRLRQKAAVAVGARVTSWFGRRAAVEEWFSYSPSGVTGTGRSGGNILMAGVRLVYSLSPRQATSVLLLGGPAVIYRFGDHWDGTRGTTSPACALGVGVDTHARRRFGIRAEIDDHLYRVKFADGLASGGAVGPWKLQQDLVASLSITRVGDPRERP